MMHSHQYRPKRTRSETSDFLGDLKNNHHKFNKLMLKSCGVGNFNDDDDYDDEDEGNEVSIIMKKDNIKGFPRQKPEIGMMEKMLESFLEAMKSGGKAYWKESMFNPESYSMKPSKEQIEEYKRKKRREKGLPESDEYDDY